MEKVLKQISKDVHKYHLICGMSHDNQFCVEVTTNDDKQDCIKAYLGDDAFSFIKLYYTKFSASLQSNM